jgi:hypothetical protein
MLVQIPQHTVPVIEAYSRKLTKRNSHELATEKMQNRFKSGVMYLTSQIAKEPLNLNSKFVKEAVGKFNMPLFIEIREELFNLKNYRVGSHAYEYSLKEKTELVSAKISDSSYVDAYRKAISEYWVRVDPWCAMQWKLISQMSIDEASAVNYIETTYPSSDIRERLLDIGLKLDKVIDWRNSHKNSSEYKRFKALSSDLKDAVILEAKRQHRLEDVANWAKDAETRKILVKKSLKTERIYTTYTNTPRDIRPFLRLKGGTITSLDIAGSHPTILALLVWASTTRILNCTHNDFLFLRDNLSFFSDSEPFKAVFRVFNSILSPSISSHHYPSSIHTPIIVGTFLEEEEIRLPKNTVYGSHKNGVNRKAIAKELKLFIDCTNNPNKAERDELREALEFKAWELCSKRQDKDASNSKRLSREHFLGQFKTALMTWINGDVNNAFYHKSYFNRVFATYFPTFHFLMSETKKHKAMELIKNIDKPHSVIGLMLSQIEAEMIHRNFKGLEILLLHDEIGFHDNQANEVKERLKNLPRQIRFRNKD